MSFVIIFYTASMARASTGGVSRVVVRVPRPPPPCARRSPGGAVITYVRRHWEVAEAVSSSSRLDGQRWRCGAGGPLPPPPPMARASHSMIAVIAKEEWQWRR